MPPARICQGQAATTRAASARYEGGSALSEIALQGQMTPEGTVPPGLDVKTDDKARRPAKRSRHGRIPS